MYRLLALSGRLDAAIVQHETARRAVDALLDVLGARRFELEQVNAERAARGEPPIAVSSTVPLALSCDPDELDRGELVRLCEALEHESTSLLRDRARLAEIAALLAERCLN